MYFMYTTTVCICKVFSTVTADWRYCCTANTKMHDIVWLLVHSMNVLLSPASSRVQITISFNFRTSYAVQSLLCSKQYTYTWSFVQCAVFNCSVITTKPLWSTYQKGKRCVIAKYTNAASSHTELVIIMVGPGGGGGGVLDHLNKPVKQFWKFLNVNGLELP